MEYPRKLSPLLIELTPGYVGWACPGCMEAHFITVIKPRDDWEAVVSKKGPAWSWDGNPLHPNFNPSVLVTGIQTEKDGWRWTGEWLKDSQGRTIPERCHSFIRNGHIEFLSDCTHSLAGQRVPMIPWPDELTY